MAGDGRALKRGVLTLVALALLVDGVFVAISQRRLDETIE
jgi:hypothetical protein